MAGLESYGYGLIVLNYATLAMAKYVVEGSIGVIEQQADKFRARYVSEGDFAALVH
jgi:hypothetical protein